MFNGPSLSFPRPLNIFGIFTFSLPQACPGLGDWAHTKTVAEQRLLGCRYLPPGEPLIDATSGRLSGDRDHPFEPPPPALGSGPGCSVISGSGMATRPHPARRRRPRARRSCGVRQESMTAAECPRGVSVGGGVKVRGTGLAAAGSAQWPERRVWSAGRGEE